MQGRNFQIRSLSWLSSALLLIVLVLLNGVFARAGSRVDLTEEGLYTLSDGSRSILGRLKDPVIIKVFWQGVPTRFDHTKRYVASLLEEMDGASDGKVQSSWVDLSEDSGKDEARELGVEQYVFQAEHGDEVRQAKGYMSLVIEMGEEKARNLDVLHNIRDRLEYLIVSTIYQRSRVTTPVIGFVSNKPFNPFGGGRQPGQFRAFEQMLSRSFGSGARTYLDLDSDVPEDVDVLIIARPRNMTAEQVYRFEQFLLRGGRGIVLEDPVDLDNVLGRAAQQAEPHASGLADWLAHVGVTLERGAVADFKWNSKFPRSRTDFVNYAYWPKVLPDFMSDENPVTRATPPMSLYWPSALSIDMPKHEAAGRTATVLATTSPSGYRRSDITGLAQADETADGKLLEEVPLIAVVEGPLTSFWLGKPVPGSTPPELPPGDEPKDAEPKGAEPQDAEPKDEDAKEEAPKKAEGSPDGAPSGSPDGAPSGSPDGPAPKGSDPKEAPKKAAPKPDDGDGDEEADAEEAKGPARLEQGDIRLLIMGDADMIDDRLVGAWVTQAVNGNVGPSFVVSAAEWMSGSDELLALRSRAMNPRNLDKMEPGKRDFLKHLNLFLVPLLVILMGLTMFFVRRTS